VYFNYYLRQNLHPSPSGSNCNPEPTVVFFSLINHDSQMLDVTILLEGRLAFMTGPRDDMSGMKDAMAARGFALVSSDLHNNYIPFAADFGPVNLSIIHRFCIAFMKRLARSKDAGRVLVYCIENTTEAQANASFLLGAFLVINFGWTAEQAAEPFTGPTAPFKLRPFHDATFMNSSYELKLNSCLKGLYRAFQLGWYDRRTFNIDRYQRLDDPAGGDMHQLCPKLIGFKGPLAAGTRYAQHDEVAMLPEQYLPTFRRLGVSCVTRLNEPDTYDAGVFECAGIRHHDLFFNDCTVPPERIVERFLDICEGATGIVAVHCRAGLGRTGTLAALWLMKHAGFGADEAIGWLRIVRPGSVIGPQQAYLKACEARGWRGNALLPPAAPAKVRGEVACSEASVSLPCEEAACGDTTALPAGESLAAAEELARQVTAGMSARGRAKAAAAAAAAIMRTSDSSADHTPAAAAGREAGGQSASVLPPSEDSEAALDDTMAAPPPAALSEPRAADELARQVTAGTCAKGRARAAVAAAAAVMHVCGGSADYTPAEAAGEAAELVGPDFV
jgi:cell division cycle 14